MLEMMKCDCALNACLRASVWKFNEPGEAGLPAVDNSQLWKAEWA